MFNDDPYGRQRVKPQQGAVGGAPVIAPAPKPASSPPAAPVINDVVAPKLRRDASMFAPVTNAFSPDAAAGKLVEHRLKRSGQAMPSTIGPPTPAGLAQPPQQGFFRRYAPQSTANIDYGSTPRPGESRLGVVGRGIAGAAGLATAIPEAFLTSAIDGTANSLKVTGGAVKDLYAGMTGAPVPPQQQVPTAAPTITTPPATNQRPIVSIGPKQIAAGVNAVGGALTRATSLAAAPQQTMTDQQIWDTRAKGRMVNGVQTFDSEWAKDPNNARRLELYAGNGNAVASVVPAPGVAASTVTGGNMPEGVLTRAPQGFTAADRATQLDNMDRQGQQYAARTLNERAVRAASYGNADAGALQEAAAAASLAQPPRIQPLQRPDPNDAARLSMEQQRLGMDQQQAGLVAEQTKLGTQSQQLQLKQAQQMQALSEQLMSGTPEQKQAAAASLAALQGTKPGEPVKVKRKMPTGQVDALGQPVMGEEEVLYIPQTGQWMAPPPAGGAGGKQLPAGVTPQNAIADAQAAIAAGAPRDAIAAELAQYGISL